MTDPRDPIDPQHLADERLRTRETIHRIAKLLSCDSNRDTYEIALEIEERLGTLLSAFRASVFLAAIDGCGALKCIQCGDDGGPFALTNEGLVCESCEEKPDTLRTVPANG